MKLSEHGASENSDHPCWPRQPNMNRLAHRRKLLIVALILFSALAVRLLNWESKRDEVIAVQTSVAKNYKHLGGLIRVNGLASLFDAASATNDPDLFGHPPGYPILISLVYRLAPDSDTSMQFVQIILDSFSAVIIFLIAVELFTTAVGVIAGLMAAFAPQFSWNSILLLPDSLAALPILLAILLITRTRRGHVGRTFSPEDVGQLSLPVRFINRNRQERLSYLLAGALIGISCWLRANALLLAPFLVLLFPLIYKRGERLRPALMLVLGAFLTISPLTIRNALVFGRFIPVSLGAGQTLSTLR